MVFGLTLGSGWVSSVRKQVESEESARWPGAKEVECCMVAVMSYDDLIKLCRRTHGLGEG